MRIKRKHSKVYKLVIKILCVILILFTIFFCLFEAKARDLVHNLVDNELEIHAMNAIDSAIGEILNEIEVGYNNLIITNTDNQGNVTSLQTNSVAVNTLKSEISLKITEYIRQDHTIKVGVPAGAFTGIVLLSSTGPDVYVSLRLGGSVTTTIKSEFNSAGINQTIHRIYLVVDADISLTCPILLYETNFITEYELCQTIIVGNTPQTFANIS